MESHKLTGDRTKNLESLCDEAMKPGQPGGIMAVLCGGKAVFQHASGMASLERGEPFRAETVTGGASLGKQFTAASIAILVSQGRVRREDDIHRFLPGLHDYGTPLTIDHLIHHTGGLKDYRPLMEKSFHGRSFGNDQVVEVLSRVNILDFKPGTKFQYCNSGYVILAEVVKRASGLPLRDFVKKHIFEPLGMIKTTIGYRKPGRGIAPGYMQDGKGGYVTGASHERTTGPGSLFTTAADMAKWASVLQGRISLPVADLMPGSGSLRELLLSRGVLENREVLSYAFGLALWEFCGYPVISHEGGAGGYRANMLTFSTLGVTLLCMTNNDGIDPLELTKKAAAVILS